jgi:hypothetical protein
MVLIIAFRNSNLEEKHIKLTNYLQKYQTTIIPIYRRIEIFNDFEITFDNDEEFLVINFNINTNNRFYYCLYNSDKGKILSWQIINNNWIKIPKANILIELSNKPTGLKIISSGLELKTITSDFFKNNIKSYGVKEGEDLEYPILNKSNTLLCINGWIIPRSDFIVNSNRE